MSHLKEFNSLRDAVNEVMDASVEATDRKRVNVEARMVFSKILVDKGHSKSMVGRYLNKSHCLVIHYCNQFKDLVVYDKRLKVKYETVVDVYHENYDPIYNMTRADMKELIFKQRRELKDFENELFKQDKVIKELSRDEDTGYDRLEKLHNLIREKVPVGKEDILYNRINIFLNGLYS